MLELFNTLLATIGSSLPDWLLPGLTLVGAVVAAIPSLLGISDENKRARKQIAGAGVALASVFFLVTIAVSNARSSAENSKFIRLLSGIEDASDKIESLTTISRDLEYAASVFRGTTIGQGDGDYKIEGVNGPGSLNVVSKHCDFFILDLGVSHGRKGISEEFSYSAGYPWNQKVDSADVLVRFTERPDDEKFCDLEYIFKPSKVD